MQTPQTNQTIKQFTPKTNFLFFVKSGLLQYNTTNKGSRPEIQDDPGERGEEKRGSTLFNTTNKGLCSMSTSNFYRDKFPQRDDIIGKTKPSVSKGRTTIQSDNHGKHSHWNCEDTGKRTEVNRRPRCLTRVGRTKGTTRFHKPEIGIETIRCKQGIVTISILHTLQMLKFEKGSV